MRRAARVPVLASLLASLVAVPGIGAGAQRARDARVLIPAGSYQPLYAAAGAAPRAVASFAVDREPVTRGDFARFVAVNPSWRRGAVAPSLAESDYLADWTTPLDPGAATLRRPVTDVSWFAARSYCAWRGGRLPTLDEWEYVAAASNTRRNAAHDEARSAELVDLYSARAGRVPRDAGASRPNAFGVRDLHELVWEWTATDGETHDSHVSCAGAAMGATDPGNYAAFLRYAFRSGLTRRTTTRALGFRCAASNLSPNSAT